MPKVHLLQLLPALLLLLFAASPPARAQPRVEAARPARAHPKRQARLDAAVPETSACSTPTARSGR